MSNLKIETSVSFSTVVAGSNEITFLKTTIQGCMMIEQTVPKFINLLFYYNLITSFNLPISGAIVMSNLAIHSAVKHLLIISQTTVQCWVSIAKNH